MNFSSFKQQIKQAQSQLNDKWNKVVLKYFTTNIRVTLGAGGVYQKGFFPTDIDILDIRNPDNWSKLFRKNSIDCLVAEHVFEHLDQDEIIVALKLCYQFLKPGGHIRIAVPDRNRIDKKYVSEVIPPKDGHKSYLNYLDLEKVLVSTGFVPVKLEYFDDKNHFHHNRWKIKDGKIRRSYRFDNQKPFKFGKLFYTSLIMDGIKN